MPSGVINRLFWCSWSSPILRLILVFLAANPTWSEKRYSYELDSLDVALPYLWNEVRVSDSMPGQTDLRVLGLDKPHKRAADMIDIPVFISITSVSFRVSKLYDTFRTVLSGIVVPTKLFLFISKHSFLMDEGIKEVPQELLALAAHNLLTIVYTENIGPHRKLLPLLKRYYEQDVLMVTMDDDKPFHPDSTMLYQLLRAYKESDQNSVIALRARRMAICTAFPGRFIEYVQWRLLYSPGRREMMILPTGSGGVLYRPRFFHPVIFEEGYRNATLTNDDIALRLSCVANGVPVLIGCRDHHKDHTVIDTCPIEDEFRKPTAGLAVSASHHHFQRSRQLQSDSAQVLASRAVDAAAAAVSAATTSLAETQKLAAAVATNQKTAKPKLPMAETGSLFNINVRSGGFDQSWNDAWQYLQARGIIDRQALVEKNFYERHKDCYSKGASDTCAIFPCR